MQIPSVMFIEMAMDQLKDRDTDILADEIKEFNELGPDRKAEAMNAFPPGELHDEMTAGYLLGLETARVLLATLPAAVLGHIEI